MDCDDTLAPDTSNWLLQELGIDTKAFWAMSSEKIKEGWDSALAYLGMIVEQSGPGGPLKDLNLGALKTLGPKIPFYPGIPEIFEKLQAAFTSNKDYREAGLQLLFFVVSGGIEDLLAHSVLAKQVNELWACRFEWTSEGRPKSVKQAISFTEKTRFIFQIHKGMVGPRYKNNPYSVNAYQPEPRDVPLDHMIYLGDGPSDIPCMSLIQKGNGYVIGILSERNPMKTYSLGYGRRANLTVPPDYSEGSHAYKQIKVAIDQIATRILKRIEDEDAVVPRH